jgi:hypothetical protein
VKKEAMKNETAAPARRKTPPAPKPPKPPESKA